MFHASVEAAGYDTRYWLIERETPFLEGVPPEAQTPKSVLPQRMGRLLSKLETSRSRSPWRTHRPPTTSPHSSSSGETALELRHARNESGRPMPPTRKAASPSLGKFCDRTRDAWTAAPPQWHTRARHVLVCDQPSSCAVLGRAISFTEGACTPACTGRMPPPLCDLAACPGSYRVSLSFRDLPTQCLPLTASLFFHFDAAATKATGKSSCRPSCHS